MQSGLTATSILIFTLGEGSVMPHSSHCIMSCYPCFLPSSSSTCLGLPAQHMSTTLTYPLPPSRSQVSHQAPALFCILLALSYLLRIAGWYLFVELAAGPRRLATRLLGHLHEQTGALTSPHFAIHIVILPSDSLHVCILLLWPFWPALKCDSTLCSVAYRCQAAPHYFVNLFGRSDPDPDFTVAKLQVAVFGQVEQFQQKLDQLAALLDTDDEDAMHELVQGAGV